MERDESEDVALQKGTKGRVDEGKKKSRKKDTHSTGGLGTPSQGSEGWCELDMKTESTLGERRKESNLETAIAGKIAGGNKVKTGRKMIRVGAFPA